MPLVSVLMLVNKDIPINYFSEAMQGILNQTLSDFELIIIDGGLKGEAKDLLLTNAVRDPRIHIIAETTKGLCANRNLSMSLAIGKYCAIADADDVYLPDRLEKEVKFLENNPYISLIGSSIRTIGQTPEVTLDFPQEHAWIYCKLFLCNAFAHSTVMWRREDIVNSKIFYRLDACEDYDFFIQLSDKIRMANLDDVLVGYRVYSSQISQVGLEKKYWNLKQIYKDQILKLGLAPNEDEIDLLVKINESNFDNSIIFFKRVRSFFTKLKNANQTRKIYPEPEFCKVLAECFWQIFKRVKLNIRSFTLFLITPFLWIILLNLLTKRINKFSKFINQILQSI